MSELPGKTLLQGYQTVQPGSIAAAGAPWQALGQVGKEIQGMGEQASAVVMKLQRTRNLQMGNDLELAVSKAYGEFQNEIATNPNPAEWGPLWEKRLDEIKKTHLPDNLAPEQQAMLGERFADFATKTGIDVARNATLTQVDQARRSYSNVITNRIDQNDFDGAEEKAQEMADSGLVDEPRRQSIVDDINRRRQDAEVQEIAQEDPAEAKRLLKEKNEDGTWKHFPGLKGADRNRLEGVADEARRESAFNMVEEFNNGLLDGSISNFDEIQKRFPKASAGLKLQFKNAVERELSDKQREMMKSPAYQNLVFGKANVLMNEWKLGPQEELDETAFEIDSMIRSLPEGIQKARLNHRFDRLKKGQMDDWESAADEYRGRFKDVYDAGGFGFTVARKPMVEIVASGLLRDHKKLHKRGLPDKEVKMILSGEADEEYLKEIGVSEEKATELGKLKGYAGTLALFRELDGRRDLSLVTDKNADYDVAAMDAITANRKDTLEYPDAGLEQQAHRKLGESLSTWEKWYAANPQASAGPDGEMEKKFWEIVKPLGEARFRESALNLPPPPAFPAPKGRYGKEGDSRLPGDQEFEIDSSLLPDR